MVSVLAYFGMICSAFEAFWTILWLKRLLPYTEFYMQSPGIHRRWSGDPSEALWEARFCFFIFLILAALDAGLIVAAIGLLRRHELARRAWLVISFCLLAEFLFMNFASARDKTSTGAMLLTLSAIHAFIFVASLFLLGRKRSKSSA